MSNIILIFLYFYSVILFIVTFSVTNNHAHVITGILSASCFIIATILLFVKLRKRASDAQ